MTKNIITINDINAGELDIYQRFTEPQLVHIYEPGMGLFIAESKHVILRALDAGYEPVSVLSEDKDLTKDGAEIIARCPEGTPVYTAPFNVLANLTGFELTRGLLCAMRRRKMPHFTELLEKCNARRIAILEGVVNPTNVGAIMRSAAALNIDAVLLTPDCADPLYRRAARVSMGTVFQIPWTYICDSREEWEQTGPESLQQSGFKLISMALKKDSMLLSDPKLKQYDKLAIILGSEGYGLCENTLQKCDHTVMIPMSHEVDSLNVAAASAVAFWELTK